MFEKRGSGHVVFAGKLLILPAKKFIRMRTRGIIPGTNLIGRLVDWFTQLASAVEWNVNNERWASAPLRIMNVVNED